MTTISSPLTMAMARRLVPFAERHQVSVAIHNQVDGNAARRHRHAGPQARARAVPGVHAEARRRQSHGVELRRGRRAARVPLARVVRPPQGSPAQRRRQPAVRRGGHADQAGAERARRTRRPSRPLIEYDYVGLRSSVDEVKASLAYCRAALGDDLVAVESRGMHRFSVVILSCGACRGRRLRRPFVRNACHASRRNRAPAVAGAGRPARLRVATNRADAW